MSVYKILYIVSHWPGAPAYGAQQRVSDIGRLLKKVGNVTLVVVNGDDDGEPWREKTEAEFSLAQVLTVKPASSRGLLARLRHELDPGYLDTVPIAMDLNERQAVRDLMNEHDVVWVHSIKTANLFGIYRWPHSVIDIDDLPSRFYQSSALVDVSFGRRILNRRMSMIWRRREQRLAERFNVLMVCSEDDRRYLSIDSVRVLPNGFNHVSNVKRHPIQPPRIGFIGTFKWDPNAEGVRWFCAKVWPLIKEQLPEARLRIVGEGGEVAAQWGRDVEGIGRVDDAGAEIATWSAMVVPVRVGGGTRIKIIEAFARKCPVVSTSLGAYGYDLKNGEEAFLVDQPDVFASHCVELVKFPQLAEAMATRAYLRFLRCWTWDSYLSTVRNAVELAAQ